MCRGFDWSGVRGALRITHQHFSNPVSLSSRGTVMQRATLALAIILGLALGSARAQSNPQFIAFQGISKAALYKPDTGPAPHVGVLVMHRTANFLNHRACTELSRRGFLLLCMNTRYENNE